MGTGGQDPKHLDRMHVVGNLLRVDTITADVVTRLRAGGVEPILLKGPSIGRWIYEHRADRPYSDTDLLVRTEDVATVERVLRALGFQPAAVRHELDRPVPAANWYQPRGGAAVDVHTGITGIETTPGRTWEILSRNTETLVVRGVRIAVLARPALALHVSLHAAAHGRSEKRPLRDLEVALARVPEETWSAAAGLARELNAEAAFAAGLQLVPAGEALATRLGLPQALPVEVLLRAETAPPLALSMQWLSRMPLWARVRLVSSKLFPSPAEFRRQGFEGARGLTRAYWRNFRLRVSQIRPAWRAVRRARTEARSSRSHDEQ